jgi:hypothetical protein
MTSPLLRLTTAVAELPAEQRAVLLPLFTWALMRQAPDGASVPDGLTRTVEDFFASLGSDNEKWGEAIDQRLQLAGVTGDTIRALALKAGSPEMSLNPGKFARDSAAQFQARREPAKGQARGGPAARFQLQSLADEIAGRKNGS